jgi:hypothetical protein
MSPAEQHPRDISRHRNEPQSQTNTEQSIETIYTTVESQRDQTDWLTVVSNLRQINRQLVEEIARLEQALASAKQSQHTHKEENQTNEITILQQQDELRIAHDRVSTLFQQLEASHQIGQRQQTLIETISQQLEITKAIVPQIESEHEELCKKYQQQSQKLIKTEQVAIELHRRLKLQTTTANLTPIPATIPEIEITPSVETSAPEIINDTSILAVLVAESEIVFNGDFDLPNPETSPLETAITDSNISTVEIEPAPPQIDDRALPNWTNLTSVTKPISSPPKQSDPASWREAISTNNRYYHNLELFPSQTHPLPETVNKESTLIELIEDSIKTTPNWPAPTVNRDPVQNSKVERSISKAAKIDLPKFPKKVDS